MESINGGGSANSAQGPGNTQAGENADGVDFDGLVEQGVGQMSVMMMQMITSDVMEDIMSG